MSHRHVSPTETHVDLAETKMSFRETRGIETPGFEGALEGLDRAKRLTLPGSNDSEIEESRAEAREEIECIFEIATGLVESSQLEECPATIRERSPGCREGRIVYERLTMLQRLFVSALLRE